MARPKNLNGGRPTRFRPRHAETAGALKLHGFSNDKIAELIDISPRQFRVWLNKYPLFAQAIDDPRSVLDRILTKALFRKATGVEILLGEDEEGNRVIRTKRVHEGETAAIKFMMTNANPDHWAEKSESKVGFDVETMNNLIESTRASLRKDKGA